MRRRSVAALVMCLAAPVFVAAPASSAAQPGPTWVAMGDSFSSGEGAYSFDKDTDMEHPPEPRNSERPSADYPMNACHRSPWAYARLLAPLGDDPSYIRDIATKRFPLQPHRLTHVACSGALKRDLVRGTKRINVGLDSHLAYDLGDSSLWDGTSLHGGRGQGARVCNERKPSNCRDYTFQGPQINALSTDTDLVTVSVGGNDVGFGDIAYCLAVNSIVPFIKNCRDRFVGEDDVFTRIKALRHGSSGDPSLDDVYRKLIAAAPQARLIVLNYPYLLPEKVEGACALGWHPDDVTWVRAFTAELNKTIGEAVAAVGDPRIDLLNVEKAFEGHELCTSEPYSNPLVVGAKSNTFHPNLEGYLKLADELRAKLDPGGARPDPPASLSTPVDTVLVIDSSGSMEINDRSNRRLDAASIYLRAVPARDRVAVVDFDGTARLVSGLLELPAGTDRLERVVRNIDSSGDTDITAALESACQALRASPAPTAAKMAILLTDGQDNRTGGDACFRSNGWPVFSLGFGDAVDSRLRTISTNTGGDFQRVDDVAKLPCEFIRIRGRLTNAHSPPCNSQLVRPQQTVLATYDVAPRQVRANFSTSWPGSDVVMALVSPSGRRVDRTTKASDVRHEVGPRFELYSVQNPEPGRWRIELFGRDVRAAGEPVVLTSASVARAGQPPTASFSASDARGRAPLTVRFDGSASSDPDGPLLASSWDFGDGSSLDGQPMPTHTYDRPGTYYPRLLVVDGNGEFTTADGPVVEVLDAVGAGEPATVFIGGRPSAPPSGLLAAGVALALLGLAFLVGLPARRPAPAARPDNRCRCGNLLTPDMRHCDACGRAVP